MKPKILVVEDDDGNIETLTAYLEFLEYDFVKAMDGEKALEIAESEKPDVIFLDLLIPKIDGWNVAQKLRSKPENKNLVIIAFSAMALPNEKEKALKCGCNAFLAKPMSPDVLIEEMKKILERIKDNE